MSWEKQKYCFRLLKVVELIKRRMSREVVCGSGNGAMVLKWDSMVYNTGRVNEHMKGSIGDAMLDQNKRLHEENKNFGSRSDAGGTARNLASALEKMFKAGICTSMLDYGTGKGALVNELRLKLGNRVKVDGYDPAVEGFDMHPKKEYDIVTCFDVLEHIDEREVDKIIEEIFYLAKNFCYIVIDLQPAVKTLADGRNAHILLAPKDWWIQRFAQKFESLLAFPIYHKAGIAQKVCIFASNRRNMIMPMLSFSVKLGIFEMELEGGLLQKKVEYEKRK